MATRKVSYIFDPFDIAGTPRPSRSNVSEARRQIAEYVKEQILSYVGDGRSPVAGGKWKRSLSKEYRKQKAKFSSVGFANMELTGDMLDALQVTVRSDGMLELKISGSQAPKADGHNNHSGQSDLPPREFIPKRNQTFKRPIRDGIRRIAQEFIDGDV